MYLPFDLAIPILKIHLVDIIKIWIDTYARIFTAVLFVVETTQIPITEDNLNKIWGGGETYKMEYYTASKGNEEDLYALHGGISRVEC